MDGVSNFYKKWVKFLKSKKLYGRYLLDIQSVNRLIENRNKSRCGFSNENFWFDMSYVICSKKDIFITKKDIFKNRFEILNFDGLQWHLWNLASYFEEKESSFLYGAYREYRKFVEDQKKKQLPIPRGFRKKKSKTKVKCSEEENTPWYNSFYQDKKVLWRR